MDKAAYDAFHEALCNGPNPNRHTSMTLEVLRALSLELAIEIGEYLERWLKDDPDAFEYNDDRESILCHLAALVPGCEQRFKEYLYIDHGEEALFPRECIRLVPTDAAPAGVRPIVGTQHEGTCGFCGLQLITLLDLDLTDVRLAFLGLGGTRLRIPMCERCSAFTRICFDVDFEGAAVWSPLNQRPDFIGGGFYRPGPSPVTFILGPPQRTFEAHGSITWSNNSQISGFPTWIQEARYPKCPKCEQPMPYIGQVENEAAWKGGQGMTYGHLCRTCRITATDSQQS